MDSADDHRMKIKENEKIYKYLLNLDRKLKKMWNMTGQWYQL